ncbi:hypothetical protein BH09SUM1_BH09SUM1_17850 [soil metagenome]
MKHNVSAIFRDRASAEHAIEQLIGMGVDKNEISVLLSEQARQTHFADHLDGGTIKQVEIKKGDKAESGAAAGAAVGGAMGAIIATIAAAGIIVAPGIGLLVAGPIVASLAGAGAGGVAGGLVGLVAGMGVEKLEAETFADEIKAGSIVVAVKSTRDASTIRKVLEHNGGKTSKG